MVGIQSFSIYGLFGTKDVHIPFDDPVKILIGENGEGKTQILLLLYYTLTANFYKLKQFSFDTIHIIFTNQETVILSYQTLKDAPLYISQESKNNIQTAILDRIGQNGFNKLKASIFQESLTKKDLETHPLYQSLLGIASLEHLYTILKEDTTLQNSQLKTFEATLTKATQHVEIVPLAIFRQLKAYLQQVDYDERLFNIYTEEVNLINFGMDDVELTLDGITKQINDLSKRGFHEISGEILSQLVKGFPTIDKEFFKSIKEEDITILLARAGQGLSEENKQQIIQIVKNKEFEEKNAYVLFFLKELIEIYNKQKALDNAIKNFRDVCNKYLLEKELVYDESSISVFIASSINRAKIPLKCLSSGEKHIISIFAKIYLSINKKFWIIFDEPELSLSVFWQRSLLPDIMDSNNCLFLLAATHSPFVFQNDLERFAIGLENYVMPTQQKN